MYNRNQALSKWHDLYTYCFIEAYNDVLVIEGQ